VELVDPVGDTVFIRIGDVRTTGRCGVFRAQRDPVIRGIRGVVIRDVNGPGAEGGMDGPEEDDEELQPAYRGTAQAGEGRRGGGVYMCHSHFWEGDLTGS